MREKGKGRESALLFRSIRGEEDGEGRKVADEKRERKDSVLWFLSRKERVMNRRRSSEEKEKRKKRAESLPHWSRNGLGGKRGVKEKGKSAIIRNIGRGR